MESKEWTALEGLNKNLEEVKTGYSKNIIEHSVILSELLKEIKPINFHERAGLSDGEPLTSRHFIVISIEEVLATAIKNQWSLCLSNGEVYVYNGAYWKVLSKEELLVFLGNAAGLLGVDQYLAKYHSFRTELMKQFITTAYLRLDKNDKSEVVINLSNGTYVVKQDNQVLRDYKKEDFLTYQLPFEFNSEAKCPRFQQFLDRVLPDKSKQLVLGEFFGYVFIKNDTLNLEKALILHGTGANGKSTIFSIMSSLLGRNNISNFSLQSLTNQNGYHRAKLKSKLVNYASEISTTMDSTYFKQLVSGEPIEARLPYGQPFILENYAKFIFNTNELPRDVEHNEAYFRRFTIIDFNVTIPEDERDPELAKKIVENELAGVFNWVLEGLKRLLNQKRFTKCDAIDNSIARYKLQSDSVQLYFQDEGYIKSNSKAISLKVLYAGFRDYCSESGCKTIELKAFTDRLRYLGFTLTRKNSGNVVDIEKKKSFKSDTLAAPDSPSIEVVNQV